MKKKKIVDEKSKISPIKKSSNNFVNVGFGQAFQEDTAIQYLYIFLQIRVCNRRAPPPLQFYHIQMLKLC